MFKINASLYGIWKNEKIEIDAMLFYIGNERFNAKVNSKSWSMSQIIQHVYMAESQTLAAIKWRLNNKDNFPTVSPFAYFKLLYTIILFRLQVKMKAPSFVTPQDEFVEKNELLLQWQQNRNEWRDFIFKLPKHLNGKAIYKHPILGYLSIRLVLIFMINHLRRHKKQLEKVILNHDLQLG